MTDKSQLWSIAIGLAKMQGDVQEIEGRYVDAFEAIKDIDSTQESKMLAAEIITASNLEVHEAASTLHSLTEELKKHNHVPKELASGVASLIMVGKRYNGTYPTDRFAQFIWSSDVGGGVTKSYESAAILAVDNTDPVKLTTKFQAFRSVFESFGYEDSEDRELGSAFLAIGELEPDDVKAKIPIIIDGLKNYLQYPLVAGAILVSIPTLEANETLQLLEEAYTRIGSAAPDLERTALIILAVRMMQGIDNKLVRRLDETPKVETSPYGTNTFASQPRFGFFPMYYFIILNHSYYATFSGMAGAHPAHIHGVGGFAG